MAIDAEAQLAYYQIKGIVADLPQEDREKVEAIYNQLVQIIKDNKDHGKLAVAMYAAKLASED